MTDYKPDYIKLKPKEPMGYLGDTLVELEREKLSFGFFSNHIIGSESEWAILKFTPYSADLHSGIKYETRTQALNEALTHLDHQGFYTTSFNLEKLIGKIRIKK
jgi:hypothetical protein